MTVLIGDWFAGSGVAGEAARATDRRYIGCEIDAAMAVRANARIEAALPLGGVPTEPFPHAGDIK